jgi:hypothetical protein
MTTQPSPSAAQLLRDIEEGWGPLRALIEAIGPADYDRTTTAGWTIKQMLAHVASGRKRWRLG